jgi:SOS response associated peptidase (SRAP)
MNNFQKENHSAAKETTTMCGRFTASFEFREIKLLFGARMINARAETITDKPSFKRLVEQRRCLIPEDGFYE